MKLSSLTCLAFELNALLDSCPNHDLPFTAIHDAAELGLLVEHLDKWFPGQIDLSLLLSNPEELTQVEIALRDSCPNHDLPFSAIHDAAELGLLVEHLDKWFPGQMDLSLLLSRPEELTQVELALRDSAEGMRGRDVSPRGRDASGLCLVMAIVLNAIQQQFIWTRPSGRAPLKTASSVFYRRLTPSNAV